MKTLVILALISLSGCATCRQHPVACSVAGAIIVGSVAASVHHGDNSVSSKEPRPRYPTPRQ